MFEGSYNGYFELWPYQGNQAVCQDPIGIAIDDGGQLKALEPVRLRAAEPSVLTIRAASAHWSTMGRNHC